MTQFDVQVEKYRAVKVRIVAYRGATDRAATDRAETTHATTDRAVTDHPAATAVADSIATKVGRGGKGPSDGSAVVEGPAA